MKQYLLIEMSEIDSRIEELNINSTIYQQRLLELEILKQRGEIVEIQTSDAFNYANLGYGDMFCITQKRYKEEGFKLIKTINNDNRKSIKRN